MIGTLNKSEKKITIVGAGMAGLLLGYRLLRDGWDVTIFEKSNRAGGLVQSIKTDFGLVETAAHSMMATQAVQDLCKELHVDFMPCQQKAKYIYRDGVLKKMPLRAGELAGMIWRAATVRGSDEVITMGDWARHHLGRPAHDYLMAPFLMGIYGAQTDRIAVEAAFDQLRVPVGKTLLGHFWGRKKNKNKFMAAPRGGMGELADRLVEYLQPQIRLGEDIKTLPDAPNVALCVPASVAADLMDAPILKNISYAPLVSVTVFVEKHHLKKFKAGVGVLIPATEQKEILGVLFNSSSYPGRVKNEGHQSLTVLMGGTYQPHIHEKSDDEIADIVRQNLYDILGLVGDPLYLHINRWEQAIPLYGSEILDVWAHVRQGWCATPGRILFGNYTGQVSLRGMMEISAAV